MDFEKLVYESITFLEDTSQRSGYFEEFYKNTNDLVDLRNFFNKTYNISTTWPQANQLFPILKDTYIRKTAESLMPFVDYYPIIDFVWYVAEAYGTAVLELSSVATGKHLVLKSTDVEEKAKEFITTNKENNKGTGLNPLNPLYGYSPVSSKAIAYLGPIQNKHTNSLIGKLSLDNFQDLSLKRALYGILEVRRKVRVNVIKNQNIPTSVDWVNKILENPSTYAGQTQIPTELAALHNNISAEQLITIATAFHTFYNYEQSETFETNKTQNNKISNKNTTTPFLNFISNEPLIDNNFQFKFDYMPFTPPSLEGKDGGYTIKNIRTFESEAAKNVIEQLTLLASYVSNGVEIPDRLQKIAQGASQIASAASAGVEFGR